MVPLVARVAQVPVFDHARSPFPGFVLDVDVFAWSKLIALLVVTCLALGMSVYRLGFWGRQRSRGLLVPRAFVAFIALAACVATYRSPFHATAIFGFPGQYEGLLAVGAYLVLFLYASAIEWTPRRQQWLLGVLFAMATAICALCIAQFYGWAQLDAGLARRLIFGSLAANEDMRIWWSEAGQMSATLYNPNFVGSFVTLLLPLAATTWLLSDGMRRFAAFALATALSFVAAGCHSKAGILGILVGGAFTVAIDHRLMVRRALRIAALVGVAALSYLTAGRQGDLKAGVEGAVAFGLQTMSATAPPTNNLRPAKIEFVVKAGVAFIKHGGVPLILVPEKEGTFRAFSAEGMPLKLSQRGSQQYVALSPGYDGLFIDVRPSQSGSIVRITWHPLGVDLQLGPSGFHVLAWGGAHDTEEPAAFRGFPDLNLFSGRAYIWSRALPLLRESALIGQGFGTFALHFPQNDFNGKIAIFNDPNVVVEKPHDLYLQLALAGGIPLLVAFLGVMGWILFHAVRRYLAHDEGRSSLLLGGLAALVGYLVCGVFNDSSIFVAPIFWILAGALASLARGHLKQTDLLGCTWSQPDQASRTP
jgi:hypothetical protein